MEEEEEGFKQSGLKILRQLRDNVNDKFNIF